MNKRINKTANKWLYSLLFALSFIVYANTLNHGFVLDDDIVISENRFVQEGFSGIDDILSHGFLYGFNNKNDQSYRPLTLINLAVEKQLFGNNPKAIHFMHVLLYALAIVLLFRFLLIAFQSQNKWMAFWIALLFALHPIHTEVVANIKSRDEILHLIFALATLTSVLKYTETKKVNQLIYGVIFYALALMSKEMAVSLIVIIPLSLWTFRSLSIKEIITYTTPFGLVLVAYFLLRAMILDSITFDEEMTVINNTLAAAESYPQQLATNFYIFSEYIKLLFLPHPLSWDYSYPHFKLVNFANPRVVFTMIGLLLLFVWSLIQLKAKNIFAYCFVFFIASFAIVSNFFILIGSTLGERLLFFPSIAFLIFLVFGLKVIIEKWIKQKRKAPQVVSIVFIVIALLYSAKTIDRNADWKDSKSLFQAGVQATPNNSRAHSALASAYREEGEGVQTANAQTLFQKAIEHYQLSIALFPANTDAWYNLGVTYLNVGKDAKAKEAFEKCLKYEPDHILALNNLGVVYFRNSNYSKALDLFTKCVNLDENFQNAQANLGAVHHNLGNFREAELHYKKALELNPNDINTKNNYRQLMN
jgi:tetratricopeptide (TPR) repeat protein